jgi:hypothetical protein
MTGVLTRFLRDVRLVPIVLTATIALFALKALGLVLDAGYLFDTLAAGTAAMGRLPARSRRPGRPRRR